MIEHIYHEPDIYRIFVPLPENPLKNLNCYVIASNGETLIIDTGFNRPECKEALFDGIRELNIDLSRTRLFLTHLHSDHCGLAEYFVEKGVPVYMNTIDYDHLKRGMNGGFWNRMEGVYIIGGFPAEELRKQMGSNQAILYAPHHLFPIVAVHGNDLLTVGELTFRCIYTPGHTPGHTCLYLEDEQILFSGDHVLFDITPNIGVWNDVPTSLADYINSLEQIRSLKVRRTFPGHREFNGDLQKRIDVLIAHHHERLLEILTAIADYPNCTAYETAGKISWSARGRAWEDFAPTQKWFALSETLAHLKWLLDHNAIAQTEDGRYHALCSPAAFQF